jgi:Flp pilus assembly protein TadB
MSSFLNPVFKEEPTTTPRFPCPSCREIITLGAERCKYCDALIDAKHAEALNADYQKVTDAVASANSFRLSIWVAALTTIALAAGVVLNALRGSTPLAVPVVSAAATVYAVNWFRKYGRIRTDDSDFPEALRAMRWALAAWCIADVLQIALIGYAIANGWLRVAGTPR